MSTLPPPPHIPRPPLPRSKPPLCGSSHKLDNIHAELRNLPQWVLWRKAQRDGKTTKVPYQANGEPASTTNASTWCSYDEALNAYTAGGFDGIGFVFTSDDPWAGIDLDHAIDADGTIQPWAHEILDLFPDAYVERSQSGTGIHIIVRGTLPSTFGRKKTGFGNGTGAIEVYDKARYFVMTGDMIGTRPQTIGEANIAHKLSRYFPPPLSRKTTSVPTDKREGFQRTDDQLITVAMSAKNRTAFTKLFKGDLSDYNDDHSAADQALANHLAFYTPDPERIDRLFRRSGLMRDKWERDDYREATIRKALESCTARYGEKPDAPAIPPFVPFPTDHLPEPLATFIREEADTLVCDEAAIALPLLAALASAIGNTRQARIKQDWFEPCILWVMLVANTGSKKTPILSAALQFVLDKQRKLHQAYKERLAEYDTALAEWTAQPKDIRPAEKPQKPRYPHVYVDDSTIEGLAAVLEHTPRGVILFRDELSGWLRGFNRYSNGGGEEQAYLPLFNAKALKVDRKNAEQPTLYIPRASVGIVGGIQPVVLRDAFTPDRFVNGLASRFIFAFPPEKDGPGWTEREMNPATVAATQAIFDQLYDLSFDNGKPICVHLHPDAKAVFAAFVDELKIERLAMGDTPLAGAWNKFEAVPARLSLILQLVNDAATGQQQPPTNAAGESQPEYIFADTMQRALVITNWLMDEAKRVYTMLGQQAGEDPHGQLVDLIRSRGGRLTARELRAMSNKHRGAGTAESALESLVAAKLGKWDVTVTKGRPATHFVLLE